MSIAERRAEFRRLHERGAFLIGNAFDAGSARLLEAAGFAAIASSSAGFAWTLARPDNAVSLEEALAHLRALVAAVHIPVAADFENGFADTPEDVAANVRQAVATGLAGLSIEDSTRSGPEPLYPFDLALQRVRAARAAIDASGEDVVLTARTEGFLCGRPDMAETISRLQAFAEAGADCLFAPGLPDADAIGQVVAAVAPKPVNVIGGPAYSLDQLAALGVRRISVGGGFARVAYGAMLAAAREMLDAGRFDAFKQGAPAAQLNNCFGLSPDN